MQLADVDAVAALNLAATAYPWSPGQFIDSLQSHDCHLLVAGEQLLGFMVLQHSCGESCLLNIAIHPDFHKRGYAHFLLSQGLQRCISANSSQCYLEVRASNTAAIALYFKTGFEDVGLRKNYYPAAQGREHAKIMIKKLPSSAGDKT